MSAPTQTCQDCGRAVVVTQNGRGFPPDIARRKLQRLCKAAGCPCDPKYRAGVSPDLAAVLRRMTTPTPSPALAVRAGTDDEESETR